MYKFPSFPKGLAPSRTVLVYPSKEAIPITDIDPESFDDVVVLDCTWNQAHSVSTVSRVWYGSIYKC